VTPKTALFSLVIAAACLALVVISSGSFSGKSDQPTPTPIVFELPPSDALKITSFDTYCEMQPWVMRDIWISNMGGVRWPVAASRVRAAMDRLTVEITEGSIAAEREDDARFATAVEFVSSAKRARVTMRSGVGGAAEYRVESNDGEEPLIVSSGAAAARMFTPDSLRMWREATALIAVKGKETGFRASAGELTTELSRDVRGWMLAQPVRVSANDEIVRMQIGALRTMRALRILSEQEVPRQMFETPLASFELVTALDDGVGTLRERVEIGGAADLSNQTVFVRVAATMDARDGEPATEGAWGPAILVVERADVERLTADPRVYASTRATDAVKADVLTVVVRSADAPERTFDRRIEGWSASSAEVNALVQLLCDTNANFTHLDAQVGRGAALCEVELRGGKGVIGTFILREPQDKTASNLIIDSGGVAREYAVGEELLRWLVAR
jgi:hypothetical protein